MKGAIRTPKGTPNITLKKIAFIHTKGMWNAEGIF